MQRMQLYLKGEMFSGMKTHCSEEQKGVITREKSCLSLWSIDYRLYKTQKSIFKLIVKHFLKVINQSYLDLIF